MPCELGIGSRGESIEVLGEDEAEGRKTLEVVEQITLAGVLEALQGAAVGVVEKLQAVLVGVLGCLRPEGPDEPFGAGTQEGGVVEDELLGSGEIGVRGPSRSGADTLVREPHHPLVVFPADQRPYLGGCRGSPTTCSFDFAMNFSRYAS